MKLGVLTNLLGGVSLEEALKYFKSLGLEMVEIGCGGFPGKAHADPDILLNDDKALEDFKALLKKYDVEISALSCHGNPVHPNKEIAKNFDEDILPLLDGFHFHTLCEQNSDDLEITVKAFEEKFGDKSSFERQ